MEGAGEGEAGGGGKTQVVIGSTLPCSFAFRLLRLRRPGLCFLLSGETAAVEGGPAGSEAPWKDLWSLLRSRKQKITGRSAANFFGWNEKRFGCWPWGEGGGECVIHNKERVREEKKERNQRREGLGTRNEEEVRTKTEIREKKKSCSAASRLCCEGIVRPSLSLPARP